jgi:hypothetical protein
LRAKFGKPAYKGRAGEGDDEETSTYGPRDAISLEFPNTLDDKGRLGNLAFILGPEIGRRRTVQEAIFGFASPMHLDQAISTFGDDYFQIDLAGSSCVGDDVQQGVINDTLRFPALVYPNKGLTVVENYITKKVHYYYYSLDCNKAQITQ